MTQESGVFVIAEAGVNHNGSLDRAIQLVDIAAECGADAVKFQTFKPSEVVSETAPKASYQLSTTDAKESQLDMIRKLELSEAAHETLLARAQERGIVFLSTPFDLPSIQFLAVRLRLGTLKVPSGEITNAPYLLQVARSGTQVIMSTGMSTLAEIEMALGVLAFGFTQPDSAKPAPAAFQHAYASDAGQTALLRRVRLLHCTTEYPAPYEEVNLKAMHTMREAFNLPVGISDHTQGIHVPVAAVALGACLVEKHFTIDRRLPGPDHAASAEPAELAAMVRIIRETEKALGDGRKRPSSSEWKNRLIARKSLVAGRPIRRGEAFSMDNLACKRPGGGRSPFEYWTILGQICDRDYSKDEVIEP